MSAEPFELRVSNEMRKLWEELGLEEHKRQEQIQDLVNSFRLLYLDALETLTIQCQDTRLEIEKVQSTHRQAMIAFGVPEHEISVAILPIQPENLLQQLDAAKKAYENFKTTCADRIKKLESLAHISAGLFDTLGIPENERGEFAAVGDVDFSRERINRFRQKIQDLNKLVEERTQQASEARTTLKGLVYELSYPLSSDDQSLMDSDSIDLTTLARLTDLITFLEDFKQKRIDEISKLAMDITHLWELLSVSDKQRAEFLKRHSTISEAVMQSCRAELARLTELRNERLPELIAQQKLEVEEFYSKLHIAIESRPRFEDDTNNMEKDQLVREFMFYESEILRLKKLSVDLEPLLTSIYEREEIVSDYESVIQKVQDSQRLLSRERGYAQQLMREEKARRRYKVVLPRLDKKLLKMLNEYREKHGSDFEWDGTPYIDRIGRVLEEQPAPVKKVTKKAVQKSAATMRPTSPRRQKLAKCENDPHNKPVQSFRGLPAFMI